MAPLRYGSSSALYPSPRAYPYDFGLLHHRHVLAGPVQSVEGSGSGEIAVEGMQPSRLEVDGVGQHQTGHGVDGAFGDQILDLLARLIAHPVVDRPAGGFGVGHVVDQAHPRSVVLAQQVEELRPEGEALLSP